MENYDIKDDVPQPQATNAAQAVESEKEPAIKTSQRTPFVQFSICANGIKDNFACERVEHRVKAMSKMVEEFIVQPKGYDVVSQPRQLVVLSVSDKSLNPKDQIKSPLKGKSGLVLPVGTKRVRSFEYLTGNQHVRAVEDVEGAHVVILVLDEESGIWFRKTSKDPIASLERVQYESVQVMANGVYFFEEANGRRTYVGWGDTTLTEYADDEAQKLRNSRYMWSQTRYDGGGLIKRLLCVDLGRASTVDEKLLVVQYRTSRIEEAVSLSEQIESIRCDDGTKIKAGKLGFSLYKESNGRPQYMGTTANPDFQFDEFGNLTYTESLFDERKGETRAADDAPVYRVTKFLDHRVMRKRIR